MPLFLPDKETVTQISIDNSRLITSSEEISLLYEAFLSAETTDRESLNDTPSADECYAIRILSETNTDIFFYKREYFFGLFSQWYLEQPYRGIYKLTNDAAKQILDFFGD